MSKLLFCLFISFTGYSEASSIIKIKQAIVCHKGKQTNGSKFKNFCKLKKFKQSHIPWIVVMTETNSELLTLQKRSKMAKLAPKDFCLTEEGTTNPNCILRVLDIEGKQITNGNLHYINSSTFGIRAHSIQPKQNYFLQLEKLPDNIKSNLFLIELN